MSRNSAVASSPPVVGTNRDCDLQLCTNGGTLNVGEPFSNARNLRTGLSMSKQDVQVVLSSTTVAVQGGRIVADVTSGLGNGAMICYGIPVCTDHTLGAFSPSAYELRRGVTVISSTMFAPTSEAPNNDVGMMAVIGGGSLAELLPVDASAGNGKSGFGIWMLSGGGWFWGMKSQTDAAGDLTEAIALPQGTVVTKPRQAQMRVYDQGPGLPNAHTNARVELWWQGLKFLTRYWTNPTGVTTPVLPVLDAVQGAAIYPQIRNTSTGPAHAYFGDFSLIHGPVNEGTI